MELRNTRDLMPSNIGGAQRKRLNEFLKNLLISTTIPAPGGNPRWRKINNVVMVGADDFKFSYDKAGGENISITVCSPMVWCHPKTRQSTGVLQIRLQLPYAIRKDYLCQHQVR